MLPKLMTVADFNPAMLSSLGYHLAWVMPTYALFRLTVNRLDWLRGRAHREINGGRLFTANPDGGFRIQPKDLEYNARSLFECEEALGGVSTIRQLPHHDEAA